MKPLALTRRSAGRLALLALLALGACSGTRGGVVYNTTFTAGYVPASFAAAMPQLVETYGSPSAGLEPAAVTQASVEGLRRFGPAWFPRNYTGNPEDAPRPAYLLRIAYGVPKAFNRQTLCGAEMSPQTLEAARTSADEGTSRTVAALCRGASYVALAEGSPGIDPNIEGEKFGAFVGLLGRQLLPRRNPVTQDDCLFRRCD
jgi:hypothetical protein